VNSNLLGGARTLGVSERRTFNRILLPLARPGLMAGLVLAFTKAPGFRPTWMLSNISGRAQTMPVGIFFVADGGDMKRWMVLIVLLSLAAIFALDYWAPRRQTSLQTESPEPLITQSAMRPHGRVSTIRGADTCGLMVEFYKRYPGFELSAPFSTGSERLGLLDASASGQKHRPFRASPDWLGRNQVASY